MSDLNWSQAAMAGALGVVNVRPGAKLFNHDSSAGNIANQVVNEYFGQEIENFVASQF